MASDYYKLSKTTNRHTDWTTEVVLEVNEETGEPTKVVRAGEPVKLSAADRDKLKGLGYEVEQSSAKEAEAAEKGDASDAGGDVANAAPLFGDSELPDQNLANVDQAKK